MGSEKSKDQGQGKPSQVITLRKPPVAFFPSVIAIASSTGGPQVLGKVLSDLKTSSINLPILITQHMPRDFTGMMASQISAASGLKCAEAKQREQVQKGNIYVAPGDFHMTVRKNAEGNVIIKLNQSEPENFCRPAADPMFRSLCDIYGANKILAVVLTGMGSDGLNGCRNIAENGGVVIAQDEKTSAVWGMPGAVAKAGLCTKVLPAEEIASAIREFSGGKIT